MSNEKKFFKKYGYNTVALPRENISPLDFLIRQKKSLRFHCKVGDIVAATHGKEPEIIKDEHVADLSGAFSRKLDFGLGLNFLQQYLSIIGAAGLGIEACYKNAKEFVFTYSDILRDSFVPNDISNYLKNATPDLDNILIKDFDEKGESYLITSTLKSKTFTLEAKDSNGIELDINITGLQGILDANPKFKGEWATGTTIKSTGKYFLKFAIQMMALWINKKEKKFEVNLKTKSGLVIKAIGKETVLDKEIEYTVFYEDLDLDYEKKK